MIKAGDCCIAVAAKPEEEHDMTAPEYPAVLRIEKIENYQLENLTDELAKIENFKDSNELKQVLKYHYPRMRTTDTIAVYYFTCYHYL